MKILEFQHVSKSFGAKSVFQDIDLGIPERGITSILGKNGAGKTTIIKCMLRLLTIDKGTILYRGQDYLKIPARNFYHKVAAVLEGNRNIYWYMTGQENLLYFGRQKGLSDKRINEEAKHWMALFELEDAKNQKVGTYSRGMQQKLSIIIALLGKPEVLFLDEPTLGLDYISKNKVIHILNELAKDMPILLTSHQMDVVEKLCQHLIILHNGFLAFEGTMGRFCEMQEILYPYEIMISGNVEGLDKNFNISIKSSDDNIHTLSFLPSASQKLGELLNEIQNNKMDILNIKKSDAAFEQLLASFYER